MMIGKFSTAVLSALLMPSAVFAATPATHPLDGLYPEEFASVTEILTDAGHSDGGTRYNWVTLEEPDKAAVKAFQPGAAFSRRAVVYMKNGPVNNKAIVDLVAEAVVSFEVAEGEGMLLIEESFSALDAVAQHPDFQAALDLRGIPHDEVFCIATTAGHFDEPIEEGNRLLKVPCFQTPAEGGSGWWSRPISGLVATVDLKTYEVLEVVDSAVTAVPQESFGYTLEEIEARFGAIRGAGSTTTNDGSTSTNGGGTATNGGTKPYKIVDSVLEWDFWRFHFRVDRRPGLILNQIEVNDHGNWRSILYSLFLSEVFVPYMDPTNDWYYRTYMDGGEYGMGIFFTPLNPGLDCPSDSTFLDATFNDDFGQPLTIPGSMCVFERMPGDPIWRHWEYAIVDENGYPLPPEGRPWRGEHKP